MINERHEQNPYAEARGVFYDRYMVLSRAIRQWQLVAFALLSLCVLLAASALHLGRSQRLIPYLIERDALGRTRYAGVIQPADIAQDELVASQLAFVITNLRTIYQDAVAQTDMINAAYRFVTPEAARYLSAYFASPDNNPIALGQRQIRRAEIEHAIRVPGSDSWNLAWRETTIQAAGGAREESAWQAYVTVVFEPPTNEETARANPLGLYISGMNWSRQAP